MSETLERLQRLTADRREHAEQTRDLVETARLEGESWEKIGAALGVTRQAAQQMYGRVRVIEGDK